MFKLSEYNKNITQELSDLKASENTRKLYQYLYNLYGTKVISGQMENAWNNNCKMLNRVHNDVNKYPALMGYDFLAYTIPNKKKSNLQIERAINFWNSKDYEGNLISNAKHGIITFMWHWNVPTLNNNNYYGFYSNNDNPQVITKFRIPYDTLNNSWITDSFEYKQIISDLELISTELQKLQELNIPILWRPLHEATGNIGLKENGEAWFWWGHGSKTDSSDEGCRKCYLALYKLMYDFLQNKKNLHNLIWVWNAQNTTWYPGDEFVDIIGYDVYREPKNYEDNKAILNAFTNIPNSSNNKMLALTENGVFPTVDSIFSSSTRWSFFMTWNDGCWDANHKNVSIDDSQSNFWSGNFHNEDYHKKEVFSDSRIITLDDIEDFTNYSL